MPEPARRVLIAGGGFSGLATVAALVRRAASPLSVDWVDERGSFGLGLAYGDPYPHYLLNVRADRMGAYADAPEGFYAWLQTEEGEREASAFPEARLLPESFLPRALYGRYLAALREEVLRRARETSIAVTMHPARAVSAGRDAHGISLILESGAALRGDALVLATGNRDAKRFPWEGVPGYVSTLWESGAWERLIDASDAAPSLPLLVIGTGLTMVDAVLRLRREHPERRVIALSRRGLLPRPHAAPEAYVGELPEPMPHASKLMRALRRVPQEVAWQAWMDALRPVTGALWQGLRVDAQRRALRHGISWWNVHRHRVPVDSARTLETMRQEGRLRIVSDAIGDVERAAQGVHVRLRRGEALHVSAVLNSTGPQMELHRLENSLLKSLLEQGAILPSPCGIGVAVAEDGAAAGSWPGRVHAIGPLLAGAWLETTAVPEIRRDAAQLAARL